MPLKDKEKHKEYQKEYQRKWRKENPEKIKKINKKSEERPERKEYVKDWQKTNPKFKKIRKKHYWNGRKEIKRKLVLNIRDSIIQLKVM